MEDCARSHFDRERLIPEQAFLLWLNLSRVARKVTGSPLNHPVTFGTFLLNRDACTLSIMDDPPRYWYSAPYCRFWRRPITWEGWACDLGLGAIMVCLSPWLRADCQHPLPVLALVGGLIAIYIVVKWWKGEPQRCDD